MNKITDDLLAGISDNLTNEIELFLLNNIEDKEAQKKIISMLNKSFEEGAQSALEFYDNAKSEFKNEMLNFSKSFDKTLLDGQDDSVSK